MHRLLIERGTVIDSLIHDKGTSRPGAAFRPGREADMMRRLVARHEGALPLADGRAYLARDHHDLHPHAGAFDVAIDGSVEPERMRDLARFYFGFSVKLMPLARCGGRRGAGRARPAISASSRVGRQGRLVARPRAAERAADHGVAALHRGGGKAGRSAGLCHFAATRRPDAARYPHPRRDHQGQPSTAPKGTEILVSHRGEWPARELLLAVPAAYDVARFGMEAGGRIEGIAESAARRRGIAVDGEPSLLYQKPRSGKDMTMTATIDRPVPRPGVLDIAAYVPGKSKATGGAKLYKLSSNETPLGPEPGGDRGLPRGCGQARTLSRRRGARASRGDRRGATGSMPDRIVCGAGSDEILTLLAHAYVGPGDEAIYCEHGFLVYPIAIRSAGGTPVAPKIATARPMSTRSSRW